MKKALSIVLSVAMLMTVICSMFVMPASAEVPNTYSLLNEEYIAEGAEFITVNEDGTWTVTGAVALAPRIAFDYTVHYNVIQQFTSTAGVSISFLDRDPLADDGSEDPNGDGNGYGEHWINLHGNWEGGDYFPAGEVNQTNSILGVYNWNIQYSGWANTDNMANLRAVYITPADGGTVTLTELALNNGVYDYDLGAQEYDYSVEMDLADKNVDNWSAIPTNGSRPVVTVDGDVLMMGNTAGSWPSAFIDYETPITVDNEAMIYADFSVANNAKTTIYLFFGEATCNNFDNGAYAVIHTALGDEVGVGNYSGYISLADIVPADAPCFDADGNILITGIKIFATSTGEEAVDPAITIRALDLLYNEISDDEPVDPPVEGVMGDMNGDGSLAMMDAFTLYRGISGATTLTDAQKALADINGDGNLAMMDAFTLYRQIAGLI